MLQFSHKYLVFRVVSGFPVFSQFKNKAPEFLSESERHCSIEY